jgi:hypothetical protein
MKNSDPNLAMYTLPILANPRQHCLILRQKLFQAITSHRSLVGAQSLLAFSFNFFHDYESTFHCRTLGQP